MKFILAILTMHTYCLFLIRCTRGDNADQYIGCYYDKSNRSNWTVGFLQSRDLSINRCLERCRNLSRTYAILQRGKDCLCGDSIKAGMSNDLCNVTCSGNSAEYCGGSKTQLQYSVSYSVCPIGRYLADCSGVCHCKDQIPCDLLTGVCPNGCEGNWTNSNCNEESTFIGRYIGCYKDSSFRAMPVWHPYFVDSNPIRWCSRVCAMNASTYAGLQHYDHCFCGNSYDLHGKSDESECSAPCHGNSSQICGGAWRNSIYSVCSAGRFGQECLGRCNCRENEVCSVLNGACDSGCKSGWTGASCNMRDCSSSNGDCSENETCVTVNLGYASVSRCVCSSGYGRDMLWDKCRDLDECSLYPGLCDNETETCQNTIGGFNCNCNSRFERIGHYGKCQDLDECTLSPGVCDGERETCQNTIGGFNCTCRSGFERIKYCGKCHETALHSDKLTNEMAVFSEDRSLRFSSKTIVGVAVGSAVGTTIVFLIIGLLLMYRRNQRTATAARMHDDYNDQMTLEMSE